VIFAPGLRYIVGTTVSIEARLYTIASQVNRSAATAFTLPGARAIQQDATSSATTILMLVSDHPMANRPERRALAISSVGRPPICCHCVSPRFRDGLEANRKAGVMH
jgi:hypothetical protein